MNAKGRQNYGNLGLVRGGQYARRPARVVEPVDPWLDREMQEVFAGLREATEGISPRSIYDASEGYQWPWRRIGQRIREARAAGAPKEQVRRIARVLDRYIDAQYDDQPERAA